MIAYIIVFAVGLFLGAVAGVAAVALRLARSERRAGSVSPEKSGKDNR